MPWLRLMRLPTVFTALANVLCGYYVSSANNDLPIFAATPSFWLLLLSSAGLYLGGMVLNDVFDSELDSVERPERPIPSGAISKTKAAIFGCLLMGVGIVAAGLAGQISGNGTASIGVAIILTAAVILYDSFLKSTILGPVGMASCRFLNIMLGASCCGDWGHVFANPQLGIAIALGIYVFGITWFARNEAGDSTRLALSTGLMIALCGIGLNLWSTLNSATSNGMGASIALSLVAANVFIRCTRAIKANQSILLQKTVGFMLLNIIFMDAAMVFFATGSGRLATTVVILVIPATLMKRFIPLS